MLTVRSLIAILFLGAFSFIHAYCQQPPLSISISTPKTTVKLGAPIALQITVKNTSSRELLNLHFDNPPELQFQLNVADAQGNQAPLTEFGRAVRGQSGAGIGSSGAGIGPAKPGFGFKAGESRKINIVVNSSYDLSRPGNYVIQVQFKDPDRETLLTSNTLTVSVVQ